MRWRLLGLFFFAVAGGVAWLFWIRPEAEVRLKSKAEEFLSQRFGQDVRFDSLSLHPLLFWVEARGVRVGPPESPVFTCARWTFYTAAASDGTPFSFLLLTFARSDLDRPSLRVSLPSGGPALPPGWWRALPFHRLTWNDGSLDVSQDPGRPSFALSRSKGSVQLSPGGVFLNAQGSSSVGEFHVKGSGTESLRRGARLTVRGEGTVRGASLDLLSSVLPERFGRWLGVGDLSVVAAINDFRGDRFSWKDLSWGVDARLGKAIWLPPDSRPKDLGVPVEGRLSYHDGRAELKGCRLFGALEVNGVVETAPRPLLDLSWKGDNVLLSDLAESGAGALRSLPQRGALKTEGTVRGTLDRPEVIWTSTLQGVGYPGFLLPDLTVSGRWKEEWVSLVVTGMAGRLEVGGTLPSKRDAGGAVWTLRASNLDLATLAQRNGWPRVRGLFNGSFSFVNSAQGGGSFRPAAEGTLRIDDFAWGVHSETAPVKGRLSFNSEGLRVQGDRNDFDLDVRRSSGTWRVDRLSYAAGGLRAWGHGFLRDADGHLLLEGGVAGLALADVPPLAKRFPLVEGRMSTEGRLHGRWDDPIFSGTIRVEDARWRPGGVLHQGRADLRGGRGGLTVSGATWDDHLRGEGDWLFGKGGRLSVEATDAPGEELFDFLASSGAVGGVFSGKLSLSFDDRPGAEGWGRFEGRRGRWRECAFDQTQGVVYFRGSHVELESIEVVQKDGSLRSRGEARLLPLNPAVPGPVWEWRFSGESERFTAGTVGYSGAWTANGHQRFREGTGAGIVLGSTVTLVVDGTPVSLGEVRVRGAWSPDSWQVEDFTSERGMSVKGRVDLNENTLSGQADFRAVDLGRLFPDLSSGDLVRWGRISGTGTFGGSWTDPWADLSLTLSGAGGKTLSVDGDVRAVWKGNWEVPRFSIRAADPVNGWGGEAEGTLSPPGSLSGSSSTLRLAGRVRRGEDIPLRWESRFAVVGATATVRDALLLTGEGRWRLLAGSTVSREKDGGWAFDFNNEMRNIHVGPLQLFGGLRVEGRLSPRDRMVAGRVGAESLWINQRMFTQSLAEFRASTEAVTFSPTVGAPSYVNGRIRLNRWPQAFFENVTLWDSGRRILVLAGEVGPSLWDFSLQGWGLQAETLLSLADFDWALSGPWTVKVRGQGSLRAPDVRAEVVGGPGHLGPLPYDRLEGQAHWTGDWIDVRELRMTRRRGYVLKGSGRFPVREESLRGGNESENPDPGNGGRDLQLNLRLSEGNLALLKDVWPLCRSAAGSFSGELSVEPDTPIARMSGSFQVRDGRMDLESYAPRVRELNGALTFQNDRVRVEHARARVGSGWIEMAGDVNLHGFSPVEYDLSIQSDGSRGVAVEVPQLGVPPGPVLGRFAFFSEKLKGVSSGEPRVSLRVKGPHGEHVISGTAVLEETHFTYPPSKDSTGAIPGPMWWRNFWRKAGWDVRFITGKETWYRNEYVNVRLDGALHLVGRPGTWALNGRVDAKEGAINYLGQLFEVKRGVFEVVTEDRPTLGGGILPFVSGEAERVVTTVDPRGLSTDDTISMVVDRALLGEIQPRFVSRNNPDLKSDRVAMKALGLSSEQQGTPADRDQLFRAGLVQLVGSSAAPFANRLAQKFGIGMISPIYEPPEAKEIAPTVAPAAPSSGSSAKPSPLAEYLRGAGASARIRLTDRLSGVYKVKLDEAKNQTYFRDQIELILRLKGSLYVRASSELDSESLLGQPPERRAVLENQWRFGLPKRTSKAALEPVK